MPIHDSYWQRLLAKIQAVITALSGGTPEINDNYQNVYSTFWKKLFEKLDMIIVAIVSGGGGGGGIPDAPADGKQYARKDHAWNEVIKGGAKYTIGKYNWCDLIVPENGNLNPAQIPVSGKDILFVSNINLAFPPGMGSFSTPFAIEATNTTILTLTIGAGTRVSMPVLRDIKAVITGTGTLNITGSMWRCTIDLWEQGGIDVKELYDSFVNIHDAGKLNAEYIFNAQVNIMQGSEGEAHIGEGENTWFYDNENSETLLFMNRATSCNFFYAYDSDLQDEGLVELDASQPIVYKDCVFALSAQQPRAGIRRALVKIKQNGAMSMGAEFINNIVTYGSGGAPFTINALACLDADTPNANIRFVIDRNRLAFRDVGSAVTIPLLYMKNEDYTNAPTTSYCALTDNVFVLNTETAHNAMPSIIGIAAYVYGIEFLQANRNRIYSGADNGLLMKVLATGEELFADPAPTGGFTHESGNYDFAGLTDERLTALQSLWY